MSGRWLNTVVGGVHPIGVGASRRRTSLVLLAATLLPLIIYASVSTSIAYRDDRRAREAATLARAVRISDAVDARLASIAAMMRALGTIRAIRERNWQEARSRSLEIASLDRDWRNVTLVDLGTSQALFDLKSSSVPLQPLSSFRLDGAPTLAGVPQFGDIRPDANGRPQVVATMRIGSPSTPGYLLQITLDPSFIQRILLASAPREGVSAVVDSRGVFIARTKAASSRVGKPATRYVRQAIRDRRSGIYRGVTYEGLENYTAYFTSARTGWSTHVAVPSRLIDTVQYGWRVAAGLAGLIGLTFALALVLLILRLVSARRAAEERVRHSERLDAVGKLTGGVAHDFNNMLAIVIGSLDIAQRRLARGNGDVTRLIENAMDGANRAADLTRRLLAFSRSQPLAPAIVDVNELIRSTGELLRRTLAANVEIRLELMPELWRTFVDPGQLENALVNLAVNARDAMPDGGCVTISTENRAGAHRGDPDLVAITVADTGTGMTPEVAQRAFEPFYTTKEVGRGTGLGLSQIHGFATQSGGSVSISSRLGQGTTLTMLLPRHEAGETTEAGLGLEQDRSLPGGCAHEILLVVEDEEQVRRTSVEMLRSLGYTVRHAAAAEEALVVLESQPGVRLMLTDIIMPGMSGRDLAKRVSDTHPEIRVLLATGFEREQVATDESRTLRKPFRMGELARRVRRELDLSA